MQFPFFFKKTYRKLSMLGFSVPTLMVPPNSKAGGASENTSIITT